MMLDVLNVSQRNDLGLALPLLSDLESLLDQSEVRSSTSLVVAFVSLFFLLDTYH